MFVDQIVSFELAFGSRREEHGQIQIKGTVWSHHMTLAGIRFGSELYRSMRLDVINCAMRQTSGPSLVGLQS